MPKLSSYSDSQLLNLIRQNDQQALEITFDRYWAQLFDFVFVRVRSVDSSRAIVQEIFIRLWLKRSYLSVNNLREYLYADAHSRSLEYLAENVKDLTEENADELNSIIQTDTVGTTSAATG